MSLSAEPAAAKDGTSLGLWSPLPPEQGRMRLPWVFLGLNPQCPESGSAAYFGGDGRGFL